MAEGDTVTVELKTGDPISELDLINRDPNDINDHLGVSFEDIIAEPDGAHSLDCVWRWSYKCFNMWKNLCYMIATTLCGIIASACWGCTFACIAFVHIWKVTPCYRALEINVDCFKRVYGLCIHCICDPCCEAVGLIFAHFRPKA